MLSCSRRIAPFVGAIALAAVWNAAWNSAPAIAQSVIPAPDELSTQVQSQGNTFEITGGQVSGDGASLFHSFSEFNLNQGETAQFLTPANTQSVLGRVVGGNPSFVDGTLQLLGSQADLYLLNPAGLVFGQNATLDVPGVFLGSTATGIGFEDASGAVQWFDVFAPAAAQTFGGSPSLLRFEVEVPGSIANFGNLTVAPGEQIWLVGGNVLQAGSLTAPAGTIAITAVEGNQLARFAPVVPFSFSAVPIGTALRQLAPPAPPTAPAPFSPLDLPALLTGAEGLYPASQVTINDQGQVLLQGGSVPNIAVNTNPGVATLNGTIDIS
ncbi:MAG: filamentous hemagglutinin N-terminal domain-containing protein, partial [Cyanobacteria bacterium P01_H01_bin.130]